MRKVLTPLLLVWMRMRVVLHDVFAGKGLLGLFDTKYAKGQLVKLSYGCYYNDGKSCKKHRNKNMSD